MAFASGVFNRLGYGGNRRSITVSYDFGMDIMNISLAEKSYNYIRRKLRMGELKPGNQLVNRELAEEIGVSVIPVREAISRLASEGLIDHLPGAGAFVRKPDRQDIENLYVLREAIESCAATEAARVISDTQLADLTAIVDECESLAYKIQDNQSDFATTEQFELWIDLEEQFHRSIVESSRNPLLLKVVLDYRAISEVFEAQKAKPELLSYEMALLTCQESRVLIQALRERDSEKARQLMVAHIRQGRRTILDMLF